MDIEPNMLKMLVRGIYSTQDNEIDCGECFARIDTYVEQMLAGIDVQTAMPLVYDHLQRCKNCREEFEALYAAVKALADQSG